MLLNLSNHPSSDWEKAQMDEALRLYGTVHDIPFPAIDPEWNLDTVRLAALQCAKTCIGLLQQSTDQSNAVHVMGELTFCFSFVHLMQQQNIACMASTTTRVAKNTTDGKLSQFHFKQFRSYF